MDEDSKNGDGAMESSAKGWLSWFICVVGWLLCAAMCLWLTITLEAWPYAYDMLFPAILLVLFCNILVFLFIGTRWGKLVGHLLGAVMRVCIGEGCLLAGLYLLGRFAIGS